MSCRLILLILLLLLPATAFPEPQREVKIGVLAFRGKEEAVKRWAPTADYLTLSIPGSKFTIMPLDFNEIGPATRDKRIDFIITNTSIYVELEAAYGISRIATLKNRWKDRGYTVFGGLIFTRSDRDDIKEIKDLKGKTFMAVDETSLGGFRMAWREMKDRGVNPFKDLKLIFGTSHDRVVKAVLNREVDAGTVRTDIIEKMAERGEIDIKGLKVINEQRVEGFPFLLSTRLYPEWPFARLRHVPEELSEKVAIALLSMSPESITAIASESAGWTTPLDYHPVHELMKELRVGPYRDLGKVTLISFVRQYWYLILVTFGIIATLTALVIIIMRLNRRLIESRLRVQQAMEGLEILVKDRTAELENKNRDLSLEIEKRKKTEEDVLRAKTEWEQTFDSIPDLIALIGPDRRILRANKPLIEKIEKAGMDIDKNYCYELMCGFSDEEKQRDCPCQRMLLDGTGHTKELYIDRLGGYYLVTAMPLKNERGDVIACIHIARDITERKKAEVMLRESEEKFRSLVERSLTGVYIIQEGRFIYVNPEMSRIFGYEPDEIINKTPYDLTAEEYHSTVRENIRKRLEAEVKAINYKFKGKRKDGSLIDVEVIGSVTEINSRPAIIGTIRDVTEQVKIEEEREAKRRFLQSILDSIHDHVMVIRPDFKVEFTNASLSMESGSDSPCYKISHGRDIPCEGSEHPCPLIKVIEDKKVFRTVHKHSKADGSEMIVEIIASPVLNEKGEIIFVIEISRDITERVRLEEEHKRLLERLYLEEKDRSIITLVGGIAHDFNNMLTAVSGSAELLRMRARKEDLPYIDNIINSSERMADLVKQMLAYSCQGIYQPSNIDLNESIENALRLTHKGRYLDIKVNLELNKGLWPVFGDRSQIEQMMVNLILNAFEAMEERGGTLSIGTSNIKITESKECKLLNQYLPEGEYVEIRVMDSGPGIPADLQKKIFDPFFTTKFMGRGLGLPAVAGIVKNHNGCLSLESEEGMGTTFTIYLPRAIESEMTKRPVTKGLSKGILVVDDDETILNLIKETLSGAGYDVYEATDGLKAIDKFNEVKESTDLAIIDIQMPGMDGKELISELRRLSKGLKIIVSSGYDEETALKGIEKRPEGFIQKPFRLSILLSKVKELSQ